MPIHPPLAVVTKAMWVAVLAVAADAFAQTSLDDSWFFPGRPAALKGLEGKPVPELHLKTWIGDPLDVQECKGKVVVIDFWATWCGPCMAAIPENVELVKEQKEHGLVFVGVHDANSGWDQAQSVVTDKGINYPVARDEDGGLSAKAVNLAFWPTYIVVDRAGIVRGAGLIPGHVKDAVKLLMAEPAPEGLAEPAAAGGLGPEWFYGGLKRPASLKAIEGKPVPKLAVDQWLGPELTAAEMKDRVVVLSFLAAGNGLAMKQAESLAVLEREMGPQGVVVVGISGREDTWDAIAALAAEGRVPSRLGRDAPFKGEQGDANRGATAAAFGVRYAPAIVVVDRGGVVRAAGIKVEKVKELAGTLLAESTSAGGG